MLTLVDSLDTLAILGNKTMFSQGVHYLVDNLTFDLDVPISVFETNIRVLGGLLAAHQIAVDPEWDMRPEGYNDELLDLATDLGKRLLPCFESKTGREGKKG